MKSRTVLILVRHGETAANQDGIWHGSIDTPLNPRGHRQAERVGLHLVERQISAIYSSPLQRARHTARSIADTLRLDRRVEADLTEYHLGSWEGKSYAELQRDHRLWERLRDDPDFAPHGGDSPRSVATRYTGALQRIATTHPGETVVVVGHGGAFTIALASLLEGDCTRWGQVMKNCAVSELVLEPSPALLSFDYTSHLDDL